MFKKTKKVIYKVVFCDDNNIATKFGEYGSYDSYEMADHVIRMGWNKKIEDKINDGYKVKNSWIIIEKVLDK